jgi:hypothetical protein
VSEPKSLPHATPDTEGALAALIRAGQRAREIARQTGTAIVIVRDGKLVEERQPPEEPGNG